MLRCIDPAERKKLKLKTAAEAITTAEIKSERDLQKQIISLLRLKGIEPIVSRMDRKTSNNVGTPDLLFAITGDLRGWEWGAEACAWEIKLPGKVLEPHQEAFAKRMISNPNGWSFSVIRSVDQALKELNDMGFE